MPAWFPHAAWRCLSDTWILQSGENEELPFQAEALAVISPVIHTGAAFWWRKISAPDGALYRTGRGHGALLLALTRKVSIALMRVGMGSLRYTNPCGVMGWWHCLKAVKDAARIPVEALIRCATSPQYPQGLAQTLEEPTRRVFMAGSALA